MEKAQEQKRNQSKEDAMKPKVWDCGSSLYDSFELKSFTRQLDSALSTRTLSMPHLSDRKAPLPPQPPAPVSKKPSKISRSFQKFLRSVFRSKVPNSSPLFQEGSQDGFYFFDSSGSLYTIPEVPETGVEGAGVLPEFNSLVRKTASERFTASSVSISCA